MVKEIYFYLLCLVFNRPVTISGKKLVLILRLTLCILKTLLLTIQFFKYELAPQYTRFLILTFDLFKICYPKSYVFLSFDE